MERRTNRTNRYDPEYWHDRAVAAKALVGELHDPNAKRTMLQIAIMYSAMALRAETRETDTPARS
jgi:hypothetical protein